MDSAYWKKPAPALSDLPLFADGPAVAPTKEPEPWCHIADAPDDPVFRELVTIARGLAVQQAAYGVILGEAVLEYEKAGRRVGGVVMDDKVKEQRQTSWLPRVMKAAGLVATDKVRPSPVARHHKHRHTVWVLPAFANEAAA